MRLAYGKKGAQGAQMQSFRPYLAIQDSQQPLRFISLSRHKLESHKNQ
jgi:hypothetical protein